MSEGARVGFVLAAFFAAGAVNSAYLPLWFADHGLTPAQIGLVLGASSLLRVAGVPAGGWAADWLGRRRLVLLAAACVAAGSAAALPALWGPGRGLGPLLAATVLLGMSGSLLAPLTDAVTLALAAARRLDYGRTRAWGSVAYMLATAGAGALMARAGSGVVPALLAAGYAAAAVFAWRLPEVDTGARIGTKGLGARGFGPAKGPLRNPAFRAALAATALIQGSHAAYYSFAPLLWRGAGLGDGVIGLLIAEGIVAEVALFIWGRGLVERLGPWRLTTLAAASCGVRWTATALTTEVGWLAVIQVLHAGTFACQHLSAMLVLRRLPAARAGTAQTLLAALGFSLPSGALVWLTGRLYGGLGAGVFLVMAAVGAAAALTVGPLRRGLRGVGGG